MVYYKRGDSFYIKLDTQNQSVCEIFDIPNQQRIVKSTVAQHYENTLNQVATNGFIPINELEFYEKLQSVVSFINTI